MVERRPRGLTLKRSTLARWWTERRIMERTMVVRAPGMWTRPLEVRSCARFLKEEKGESRMRPAGSKEGEEDGEGEGEEEVCVCCFCCCLAFSFSSSAMVIEKSKALTAPILLPHKVNAPAPLLLISSTTHRVSSNPSNHPNEIYCPCSLFPHPEKSKLTNTDPAATAAFKTFVLTASTREEEFPCK